MMFAIIIGGLIILSFVVIVAIAYYFWPLAYRIARIFAKPSTHIARAISELSREEDWNNHKHKSGVHFKSGSPWLFLGSSGWLAPVRPIDKLAVQNLRWKVVYVYQARQERRERTAKEAMYLDALDEALDKWKKIQ